MTRARGTPGTFWVPPKGSPQGFPEPPGIAKQVIDCEKLSTSDVEIGYCVKGLWPEVFNEESNVGNGYAYAEI